MRFLFTADGFPGAVGTNHGSGIGTYLRELTLGLTERGHACSVIVWNANNAPATQEVEGIRIHALAKRRWRIIERWFLDAANIHHRLRLVQKLDAAQKFDWIEIQSDEGIDIGVQRRFPERTILRIHTTLAQMVHFKRVTITPRTRGYLRREERSFQIARRVITHSASHAIELRRLFPFLTEPVVVPHGIAAPSDGESPSTPGSQAVPVFLVIGTPDLRKGFDRLAAVMGAYAQRHGACELVIVTNCSEDDLGRFGLRQPYPPGARVRVRSNLTDAELDAEYRRATALLHLARYESFGYPLIEAAARGTPVVATETGAAGELLAGPLRKFLVDGDRPEEAAAALAQAAAQRGPTSELIRKAYEAQFTRELMVDAYLRALGHWRPAPGFMAQGMAPDLLVGNEAKCQ
jgi:glycosyltransferase involved in cell wall biosynthesis